MGIHEKYRNQFQDLVRESQFSKADSHDSRIRQRRHSAALNRRSSISLRTSMSKSRVLEERKNGHHKEASRYLPTAIVSAVINYLLMFGLCCAYGLIMFEDDWNGRHVGLAVKINLGSALIGGLALACFSGVPVAIGGPDLNPVVFLGMVVNTLSKSIAEQLGLELPAGGYRRLGGGGGGSTGTSDFCSAAETPTSGRELCEAYHSQLRATTIYSVAVSSAILGIVFFCAGRFKLTRYVAFLPTNIQEAFLSCIGYKVFKYAIKFCSYEPAQFLPAAFIGTSLYFMKALHLGNPAIVIPLILMTPLCVFYISVFASGESLSSMREKGWMFGMIENSPVESLWTDSMLYGNAANINFKAWAQSLVDLPIMIVICLMDCLLKLSSVDSKLPIKASKDYDIQLDGAVNLVTTIFGSSVSYMQLKFCVINYGIMGNVTDRRAGIFYSVLCGVSFFWSTDLINYLPRFFVSTLLFFAGTGFVVENLWGSRKYLSFFEWCQIVLIVGVFILFGSLLYAVIVGGLLAGITFIFRYAKVPCVAGQPERGGALRSNERHSELLSYSIRNVSDSWLMVIHLKGYVFFASAQKVTAWVSDRIEMETTKEAAHARLRWVVFDCSQLDGMDPSAGKAVAKLVDAVSVLKVRIIWSGAGADFVQMGKKMGTIHGDGECFANTDEAMRVFEEEVMEFVIDQQQRWVNVHPRFQAFFEHYRLRTAADPFATILPFDALRFSCPWQYCTIVKIKAFTTLLWKAGTDCKDLYLVHSGKVGLFEHLPGRGDDWAAPKAIYNRGWFLNREALSSTQAKLHAVALEDGELLCWDEASWEYMLCAKPRMAAVIMEAVLRQSSQDGRTGAASKETQIEDNQVLRRNSVWASKPSTKAGACEGDLPYELQLQFQALEVAQKLDTMGFFALPPESQKTSVPALPTCLQQNLEVAFGSMVARYRGCKDFPRQVSKGGGPNAGFERCTSNDSASKSFSRQVSFEDTSHPKPLTRQVSGGDSAKPKGIIRQVSGGDCPHPVGTERQTSGGDGQSPQRHVFSLDEGLDHKAPLHQTAVKSTSPGMSRQVSILEDSHVTMDTQKALDSHVVPIREALSHAGLHGVPLMEDVPDEISLSELLVLGQHAAFMPLSPSQEATARELFRRWSEGQGVLSKALLVGLFRQAFHAGISAAEVAGIADLWCKHDATEVNEDTFVAMMSRFVRKHEQSWWLLLGLRELMGKEELEDGDRIGPECITALSAGLEVLEGEEDQAGASFEQAEAMLWYADSTAKNNEDYSADCRLVAAALVCHTKTAFRLPSGPLRTIKRTDAAAAEAGPVLERHMSKLEELAQREHEAGFALEDEDAGKSSAPERRKACCRDWLLDTRGNACGSKIVAALSTGGPPEAIVPRRRSTLCSMESRNSCRTAEEGDSSGSSAQIRLEEANQDTCRVKLHRLLEDPHSSRPAKLWSWLTGLLIIASALLCFLEPLVDPAETGASPNVWFCIDLALTIFFSVELLLRFSVADALGTQTRLGFMKSPSTICDLVAVLPLFIDLAMNSDNSELSLARNVRLVRYLRLLRMARVARLGRLSKKAAAAGPITVILSVVWGIYMMHLQEE